ncbi:tetratricopeptide repeat protein [Sporosarcina thermotolerans]|uniref:Tetratricopeptide repeat protein n=2 Tax=Sporosarcina thermotolerans TaxID=633404 RepID=A0AAW9A7D7_9BACL|nr:tetratricopeptide repeat protein [Sporosarcina thermotolerans]MDW0115551.1 tetratricopeptide repeat protein [Sporosarcina thermotolerans]
MNQLHEFEKAIFEGDIRLMNELIDRAEKMEEFDLLYDVAGLMVEYGYIGQADHIYETLSQVMPDEAQLKIDRASTLLELGDEDEALLLLSEVTPDQDEYVQALMALADYYQMIGMAEAALGKVKEAIELAPYEPVIRFAYAELLLDAGRYIEAAKLFSELFNEGNKEIAGISIPLRIAETFSAGAAYEEALPYYEDLLVDEQSPDTLFGAAYAYYQSRQPERSIQLLENLIQMDPDYFSAYMLAGQAQSQLGEDKKAYELYIQGIARDEFDKELRLAAGKSALKLSLPDEAEEHLKHSIALDPEYIDAIITLASIYNEREQDEELLGLLAEMKEEEMDLPLLSAFKAFALEREELYDDAYRSYRKAYTGLKDDPSFLDKFARFLLDEGKRDEAIEVIKTLVSLTQHDEWAAFLEMLNDKEV